MREKNRKEPEDVKRFWRCPFKKRYSGLRERMAEAQVVSLRQLGEDRAAEVGFGRFLHNDRVSVDTLIEEMTGRTAEVCVGREVLAIQDTTELNFEAHRGRHRGLGTVGNGTDAGFFLHPMLVVCAQTSSCLGIAAATMWTRHEKSTDYRNKPIEEKESYRWLATADAAKKTLIEAKQVTIIADRESDIYEEWARTPDSKTHLLTRMCRNRLLASGDDLETHTSQLVVRGVYELMVPANKKGRSERLARIEVRFGPVCIQRPQRHTAKNDPASINLHVVDVRETPESVPAGEEPVHWCLLTNHTVISETDARKIVEWYRQRWHIEQLFRTLKTQGLNMEASQVETVASLQKLACIALDVATSTLQLTLARAGTDQPITVVFNEEECAFMARLTPMLEGKTARQKNPHQPHTLSWASWTIARLGGWKGYASEAPPGPITFSKGLLSFKLRFEGFKCRDFPHENNNLKQ